MVQAEAVAEAVVDRSFRVSGASRSRPPDGTYFVVCRACSTARRCKSSTQPDGGEELAKRKGVPVTEGLKEAWNKSAGR